MRDKEGLSVLLGIRQQAFGIIGLFSHRLPHRIYAQIIFEAALIRLLHAAAVPSRSTRKTNKKNNRFLVDVISQSVLIASIAMHFHGGVISPGAVCLRV